MLELCVLYAGGTVQATYRADSAGGMPPLCGHFSALLGRLFAAPLAEVDIEGKKIVPGNELLELEREEDGVVDVVPQHEAEPVAAVQAPPTACAAPSASDAMPETVQVAAAAASEVASDGAAVQETAQPPALEVFPSCPISKRILATLSVKCMVK